VALPLTFHLTEPLVSAIANSPHMLNMDEIARQSAN
jgi:hypothetical protein